MDDSDRGEEDDGPSVLRRVESKVDEVRGFGQLVRPSHKGVSTLTSNEGKEKLTKELSMGVLTSPCSGDSRPAVNTSVQSCFAGPQLVCGCNLSGDSCAGYPGQFGAVGQSGALALVVAW